MLNISIFDEYPLPLTFTQKIKNKRKRKKDKKKRLCDQYFYKINDRKRNDN